MFRYGRLGEMGLTADAARRYGALPTVPRLYEVPGFYGRHFSYIGDVHLIRSKIDAFSHQENNTPQHNNADHIQAMIAQRRDLYGRWGGQRFLATPIDETWPVDMLENPIWEPSICTPDSLARRLWMPWARRISFCTEAVRIRAKNALRA
jgi:hypothetical protein